MPVRDGREVSWACTDPDEHEECDWRKCQCPCHAVKADPDKPCPHEDFAASVEVNRLTGTEGGPVTAFSADIRVSCARCGEAFRWIGVPAGMKPDRPMVSVDETELHAPLRPASSDPDFGLGIPGFAIRFRDS